MNQNNQVDIGDNVKTTKREWLTIQEMVGLPGMPTTAQGCHKMMAKAIAEHPELKRKVSGSKASEFHYSTLPIETQTFLFDGDVATLPEPSEKHLLNQWIEIFNRMTVDERESVIGYVFRHGFSSIVSLAATTETDKINELLNSLDAADRKEILQRYVEEKQDGAAFSNDPLNGKKAG